ncbi:unnamed protein product [Medioppia subpectinata]|uniref:BRCT domain-containing protein n=1 Tax=Medioppia subpectinata TaxID=1979941 RepID=A0A7R9PY36_9ACAR|nr:unnamed protein product [Medioppia subpectinata]CAG2105468.1 unnamed protein product [Medioppia subpectinata]
MDWRQYLTLKREKLRNQLTDSEKTNELFAGVCVHINGVTNPSEIELKELIVGFGGMYLTYFDPQLTTHTIASNLAFATTKRLKTSQIVVKVEWILDSIEANCLQSVDNYLLDKTDPKLMDNKTREEKTTVCQPVLNEDHFDWLSETERQFIEDLPRGLREEVLADIELSRELEKQRNDFSDDELYSEETDETSDEMADLMSGDVTCANICGKYRTEEVLDLIAEWITSEEELLEEDVAYITKYFLDLIDERNIDLNMSFAGIYFGLFGHFWYKFLDKRFPGSHRRAVLKKLLSEMAMGPPLVSGLFLIVSKLKDKSFEECLNDLKTNFVLICSVEWLVYIPLQFLNFSLLRPQFRYLFVAIISLGYDAFLSYVIHRNDRSKRLREIK